MANRRDFLRMGAGVTAATLARRMAPLAVRHAQGAAAPRPNIVLLLADDLGFSDIGCFGAEIDTPNLDRLAAGGVKLNQFYNNPRCCPSRASILTGLYPHQAHMGNMVVDHGRYPYAAYDGILAANTVTIAEALRTAGYATAAVGKWHLAPETAEGRRSWPLQRGFDRFWGMIAGASVYYASPLLMNGNDALPPPPADQYITDLWADHAVEYIHDLAADPHKPFFLYAAFNAPHWPIQAPEETVRKYADRYAGGWDQLRAERHRKQLELGLLSPKWALSPRDPRAPAWSLAGDKAWEMRRMAVYAAMIDRLDQAIGRIVQAVEEAGAGENTLIIFLSDNGGNAEEIGQGRLAHAAPLHRVGQSALTPTAEAEPCQINMTCAGNRPDVSPGDLHSFQSIGIPWGNCTTTPFRLYKHYAHEGGISTPFIANWPARIKPTSAPVNAVGHETDLMPTFLELAGATYPRTGPAEGIPALVGQSLVPVLTGGTRTRGPIFWEHEGNRAVREGKWKLVSRFPDAWELFDMEADRTELHDLASLQPARARSMAALWDKWAKEIGVQPWPMPQTPPNERTGALEVPPYLQH